MKVTLSKPLIVCVRPKSDAAGRMVLKAVALLLGGMARAQSDPVPPDLEVWPGVELSMTVEQEHTCLIEYSADLRLWQPASSPHYGNGESFSFFAGAGASGDAGGFYRMRLKTRPSEGSAFWSMTGCRMLLNAADGVVSLMSFDQNQTGTMDNGSGVMKSFEWDWQRTGSETGRCVITWPSGSSESFEMEFLSDGSGCFTSQVTVDGIASGSSRGSFRVGLQETMSLEIPDSLTGCEVVFSGSGRPLKVALAPDGGASIRSVDGMAAFTSSYTLQSESRAILQLNCADGWSHQFTLRFSGPECGTYTCVTNRHGILRREASGAFSITRP